MEQTKIDRINELARIAKVRQLTEDEFNERAALRAEYVQSFRASLEGTLQNTYIVDEKGNKTKVEKKKKD